MSFKSFLDAFGHEAEVIGKDTAKVFDWLGSAQGQQVVAGVEATAAGVATAAAGPAAGAAVAAVEGLVNQGLSGVLTVQAIATAAGKSQGNSEQKAALFAAKLSPQIASVLKSLGVADPTATQIQAVATALSTGLVGIVNALPPVAPAPAA